jgi:hypothetical protein
MLANQGFKIISLRGQSLEVIVAAVDMTPVG